MIWGKQLSDLLKSSGLRPRVINQAHGGGEMTNESTRNTLLEDINNFRLKANYYESLHLFEAAKYAGNLAANLELALTTMPSDDEKQPAQNTAPPEKAAPPVGAKQVAWPVIRTQKELSQTAELQRSGGRVYELQGKKIGEILNSLKVIDDKTLHAVEQHHNTKKANGKPIGQLLVHMGIIEPEVLSRALYIQSGMPMVDVLSINITSDILARIPADKAVEKKVVPVGVYNKTLYLAVAEPATFSEQQHFAFITQLNIKPVFAPAHEIETFIHTKWTGADSDIWAG
jgi:MshEN domain